MFMGISVGIGLIVAFAKYENIRSMHRSQMATTVAAFARMTVQDSRKILPNEFYPPWLTWLNVQLDKIWPYVNEAASDLIRSNVEPILEQYTPAIFSSMKFSKLTLGTVAPQFIGVCIIEEESGDKGITMELEMQWDGNPNILVWHYPSRLVFKPLAEEFPGFGAVSYSLREKKKLDFTLKVVGGEISAIPGLSDAIEETIRDAVEDSITWPVRKIVSILPGDYSDLELKPVGTLEVKLVQGKDLTNKDLVGKSDPFAVLFIRPVRNRMKTSKTINNQLNPIWNEHFEFVVEDASTQHLTVRVFDDEGVQAAELIGCALVELKDLEPGKVKDVWLKLVKDLEIQRDNKYRGQVHLELLYCPYGTESSFKNPFNPDFQLTTLEKAIKSGTDGADDLNSGRTSPKKNVIVRGVLAVTVIAAEDLPATDLIGKADPYVVLVMKKSEKKAKTRVLTKNLNPVWNQTFEFVVEDALHDMLIAEVWDHDTFGKDKIGRCIMTLTRVLLEGKFQDSFPLDGASSGKLLLHLQWTPQLKFRDS
ncbi:hypothetical protein SADUNF_Sadunf18G0019400 [Salix dunnii]|uniref:Uncharacterized protein n=1 Tax=Salix dunnii TaxID=1413687 RepID=A0A835J2U2_9ROSI|nr:hypothetical protein SADUNF_Sadunf18G0019400 [Salix dunnii]